MNKLFAVRLSHWPPESVSPGPEVSPIPVPRHKGYRFAGSQWLLPDQQHAKQRVQRGLCRLAPAKTTGDLLNNFLGQSNPVTSALASIMAEHGTAPGLRSAESKLNDDVTTLDNTSYVTSAQSAVIVPDLKAISDICGRSYSARDGGVNRRGTGCLSRCLPGVSVGSL